MTIKTKIAAVLTTAAMVSTLLAPAVFADNTISGNGADSINLIKVKTSNNCTVHQTNTTTVGTTVTATSSTGGNHANENTGGQVNVMSGDASSSVSVSVTGGTNTATDPRCACAPISSDTVINGGNNITGNGADTTNTIKVKTTGHKKVKQKNTTTVWSDLTVKSKTGKNKANENTGTGSVDVTSGSADTMVDVTVGGSSNTL